MGSKVVFLSHIHEEKDLALLLKTAIENEFSGFVDVFVSSDEISIPAGSNFLNRIEEGLVSCIGALYLISPMSVNRNWINFELGAVWIRNAISVRNNEDEVPALPICHSGMEPQDLPKPIDNLNAIVANQSSALEFAFRSIQRAVGAKGTFRTNFDELATNIIQFEKEYTKISKIREILNLLEFDIPGFLQFCESHDHLEVEVPINFVTSDTIKKLQAYTQRLNGNVQFQLDKDGRLSHRRETGETGQKATIIFNRCALIEAMRHNK